MCSVARCGHGRCGDSVSCCAVGRCGDDVVMVLIAVLSAMWFFVAVW
jgi:hypothetical protein